MLPTCNLMMNPNHATIYFRCKFKTKFGEILRVVGNIEELGCWDPSKSMIMTTNEEIYPYWESSLEIPAPVGMEIYYKYVIYDELKNTYFWEKLEKEINRKFIIPTSGIFILNDEENSIECHVHKVVEEHNSANEVDLSSPDMGVSYSGLEDENKRKMFYDSTLEIYNSLSYDSNQLSGNDLNETFLFCLNQKISSEDRIIIASAHLPVEVNRLPDDTFSIKLTDESSIYSILYGMKEKHICEVVWVGMLRNFNQFSETELNKIFEMLQENNIYMIPVTETEYRNYWIYINKILGPVFVSSTIDFHNDCFLNYEEFFNSFMDINKKFGNVIYNIMQENDLIMINDVHLMLIPNTLLTKNTNARVGIYFHMAFPSSDVIKSFPYHQEILKSILLCDVIGFHIFQFARNFLTACKRLFGIFYEIKFRGFITLNYLGRYIIIRIMHAGIDVEYLKSVIIKKEFSNSVDEYKKIIKNKFCLVSIDQSQVTSELYFKFEAFRRFLEKFPEVRNNIILLQIVKSDECDENNKEFYSKILEISQDINTQFSNEVIKLIKVDKFTIPERFALFSQANSLFYLQLREGNCMFVNEYIALQHALKKSNINFGIIISENIGVSTALKGPIRINPYNLNSIVNALEKVYYMKEEEKLSKYEKDLARILKYTTFSWIKNFFIDLKRTTTNQASVKLGIGIGLNFRLMKLNSNFQHFPKAELVDSYRVSERRLIFLDYEGTIQVDTGEESLNIQDLSPPSRLIKLLTSLTNDPRNVIFIVTGREKSTLDEWFGSIPNLGLASEHGFFYKYPKNMRKSENGEDSEWHELFHIKDWSWKDSVLKMLQGFTEKTEGSYITKKEAIVSWYYKDCDIYFGHVQANEINTHLQNIYENCKIDIVNGKGYVEIKPKNVNKGYFISHIIKQEFVDKLDPDFILAIGDDISDEEMFKYLNSVNNQLSFFKENIKVFSCTICRKPSSAKYYLNEINEVYEYLESLNQTHHFLRKESKKKSIAKINKSKHNLHLMDLANNFNI